MSLAENVAKILSDIETAAIAAGRDPKEITLCAATKMNDSARVREAIAAGVTVCGENRVQELTQKLSENAYEGAQVHFIGHLQTNQVRQVVGQVDLIQSVDREKLLRAISDEAVRQGITQNILLQINIGREPQKGGFLEEEVLPLLDRIREFPGICIRGLMAIPPICQKVGDNDKFFQKMCQIGVDIRAKKYDNVLVDIMSMGMSDDYANAISCGSTMIRVGTAIFGARNYSAPHP